MSRAIRACSTAPSAPVIGARLPRTPLAAPVKMSRASARRNDFEHGYRAWDAPTRHHRPSPDNQR